MVISSDTILPRKATAPSLPVGEVSCRRPYQRRFTRDTPYASRGNPDTGGVGSSDGQCSNSANAATPRNVHIAPNQQDGAIDHFSLSGKRINQIRGFLCEYGIVIPKGIKYVPERLPDMLGDEENGLSPLMRGLIRELFDEFHLTRSRVSQIEKRLEEICRTNDCCRRAMKVPGVGALTATAVFAAIGNGSQFKNGRAAAAWVG